MLSPLPTLSNAGPLPLPEAAVPLRDSGSGPDFSQLMQQQADRQAALRAVDQQVATQARHADADRSPAAAAAPRAAADQPGRPADPEAGACPRREQRHDEQPVDRRDRPAHGARLRLLRDARRRTRRRAALIGTEISCLMLTPSRFWASEMFSRRLHSAPA